MLKINPNLHQQAVSYAFNSIWKIRNTRNTNVFVN